MATRREVIQYLEGLGFALSHRSGRGFDIYVHGECQHVGVSQKPDDRACTAIMREAENKLKVARQSPLTRRTPAAAAKKPKRDKHAAQRAREKAAIAKRERAAEAIAVRMEQEAAAATAARLERDRQLGGAAANLTTVEVKSVSDHLESKHAEQMEWLRLVTEQPANRADTTARHRS